MQKLPPTVYVLGTVSFFTDIASEMVYPLLPLFLTGVLGASTTVVGLVEGVAEAAASLFKVVGGRISDRIAARKPLILLGYGFPALLRPVLALAAAPWQVLGYRFLDRVGKGLRTAEGGSVLKALVDRMLRQRGDVLAFASAPPAQGGTGATLVLLRGH